MSHLCCMFHLAFSHGRSVRRPTMSAISAQTQYHLVSDALHLVAYRRQPGLEYVLDYVLERKRVDDMINSIKSRRYDRQKFNMNMCGLRHLIYLVEGNPDTLGNESGMPYWSPRLHQRIPHPSLAAVPAATACHRRLCFEYWLGAITALLTLQ